MVDETTRFKRIYADISTNANNECCWCRDHVQQFTTLYFIEIELDSQLCEWICFRCFHIEQSRRIEIVRREWAS